MTLTSSPVISIRKKELLAQYETVLENHIQDLKNGTATRAMEIRDLAALLHVHPVHLSNTIKEVTGHSTCYFYEEKLVRVAKELLLSTTLPIGQIAMQLTYDPSNFTKFFKHYTGLTPKQFRQQQA